MITIKQLFLGAVAGAILVLSACGPAADPVDELPPTDTPEPLSTELWTYIEIDSNNVMWGEFDEPEWLRYFGLAAADFTNDGYLEIVTQASSLMLRSGPLWLPILALCATPSSLSSP
ncbi:MAG: hypothetical protein AB8H12_18150 [Lewinella sp.]